MMEKELKIFIILNNDNHTGFGLNMMRERVSLLSGEIDIKTQVGEGTAIKIRIPI